MGDPWLQREGETAKNYQAFRFYLELGRGRSLSQAYELYRKENGLKAERMTGTFRDWSSEHDWVARAEAWDRHVDQRAFDRLMESKLQRKVERVQMLDKVRQQLEEVIPHLAALALQKGSEMSPKDFVNALDKVMRNYREELDDMPTERKEHTLKEANQMLDQILGIGEVTTSPQEQQSE